MRVPSQIGNYQLERMIGQGASSEVWLARHTHLPAYTVAIKVLTVHEPESLQRFEREATITTRLRHPQIVQLLDYGFHDPFHYAVLEYVEGSTLREVLDRRGRLPLPEAVAIFGQIAAALDYAHQAKVIHRDMAPANILIAEPSRRALLTDFGIAREPSQSMTVSGTIMGTPGYLSPEHARSAASVTQRSDIFGLGVIFYEMLSASLPWPEVPPPPATPDFETVISLRERGVQGMPAEIDRVLAVLLAVEPSRRYPTATAAADDLNRILTRHQTTTQVLSPDSTPLAPAPVACEISGVAANAVEQLLGAELDSALIERAHRRADELGHPARVEDLLDAWAAQSFLRMPMLGRMARIQRIASRNVYFYQLRVLYEQRSALADDEEPDHSAEVFPFELELDRWAVNLPQVNDFGDQAGGKLRLPGSTRVIPCYDCHGRGLNTCPTCQGRQRVYVTKPAAPTDSGGRVAAQPGQNGAAADASAATRVAEPEKILVACSTCSGRGGISCERCEGIGRLVQHKSFRWSRRAHLFNAEDDLPVLDEGWLERSCKAEPVYAVRQVGGMRPEWMQLEPVAGLIRSVETQVNDQQRVVLSELRVLLLPVTEVVFDLGALGKGELYRLMIYGFEQVIPPDWRFFNWERVIGLAVIGFLLVVTLVVGAFALFG